MKIYGTKPDLKNGIYLIERRGKEEDAVGTLWLRLGEDQNKRKTKGWRFWGDGEDEAVVSLLSVCSYFYTQKGEK